MHSTINPAKLADVQSVANKLAKLPEDALLYIAGYVEGSLDKPKDSTVLNEGPPTTGRETA